MEEDIVVKNISNTESAPVAQGLLSVESTGGSTIKGVKVITATVWTRPLTPGPRPSEAIMNQIPLTSMAASETKSR